MTEEQAKAYLEYAKASAEFHRKITPRYIRINGNYLNEFIQKYEATLNMSPDDLSVDYNGIKPFHDIPVVIDNLIDTYEFVYDK
jgi:hypothetical protein